MRAGELADHLVTLRSPVRTPAADGELVTTWTVAGVVWAKVVELTGREYAGARAELAEAKVEIKIRHRPDIDRGWSVLDDQGRELDIIHIRGNRRQGLRLLCKVIG
jgi:SPP1 family predicted phage head-tail adaptor